MTTILLTFAAVAVGILSTARLTRLVTRDSFPPSVWLRIKWDDLTEEGRFSSWNTLIHCHWCLAPWMGAIVGLWGYFSDLHASWWMFNLWLAAVYVSSMIVDRDEAR